MLAVEGPAVGREGSGVGVGIAGKGVVIMGPSSRTAAVLRQIGGFELPKF